MAWFWLGLRLGRIWGLSILDFDSQNRFTLCIYTVSKWGTDDESGELHILTQSTKEITWMISKKDYEKVMHIHYPKPGRSSQHDHDDINCTHNINANMQVKNCTTHAELQECARKHPHINYNSLVSIMTQNYQVHLRKTSHLHRQPAAINSYLKRYGAGTNWCLVFLYSDCWNISLRQCQFSVDLFLFVFELKTFAFKIYIFQRYEKGEAILDIARSINFSPVMLCRIILTSSFTMTKSGIEQLSNNDTIWNYAEFQRSTVGQPTPTHYRSIRMH